MIRQADDNIQQLLNKITKQAAILAHQIDMLKINHSIALIRLSLLKLPSKTASSSTPAVKLPVSPLPLSSTPPTPLSTAVPDSTTPLSFLDSSNFPSTLLSSTTASSPTPTHIESPISRVLTLPTNNFQIDSIKLRSPLLFISSRQDPPRTSIIQSLGPALQPCLFPSMPPSCVLSSFTTNIQPFVHKTELVVITVDNETLSGNFTCLFLLRCFECKRKTCEANVFIFDPGGALECSKRRSSDACFTAYDLEDKVDFEGSVMIRIWIHHSRLLQPCTTQGPKGSLRCQ